MNSRPREFSAMLCQLNYGGLCREHGHEFSIYKVAMPIEWRVYSIERYGIYTGPVTVKLIIMKDENFECLDILRPNKNTKLVAMLSATASVAQLAEHRTRFTRSRVRFPVRWPKVAFFATGPGWVLKISRHSKFSSFRVINLTRF